MIRAVAISFFLIIISSFMINKTATAQLTGNNLFEYQYGNIPDIEPEDMSTHYDQLNLTYRHQNMKVSGKFEYFYSPLAERSYADLTQFNFSYRDKGFSAEIGNFYGMIGNGILLRGYEIPASIFEDPGYRIRHGFYRDIQGVKLKYEHDLFYVKAMRGRPLINQLPPTLEVENRRIDLVEATEAGLYIRDQTVGFAFLRNQRPESNASYLSWIGSGNIFTGLSYSFEVMHELNGEHAYFSFNELATSAIYGSLNYFSGSFGASFEFKDYANLILGSSFNDPPTLVKEHSYRLLNRSTHVPQLDDESGIQAEMYYRFASGSMLTFNTAHTINEIRTSFYFYEYFLEYTFNILDNNHAKVFIDYAADDIQFQTNRITGGVTFETSLKNYWSTNFEIEAQHFERPFNTVQRVQNYLVSLGLAKSHVFSAAVLVELTNDPVLTDRVNTTEIEEGYRPYYGLTGTYKLLKKHTLQLFIGERRGGPSCTSGICYDVPDFRGMELRLSSRF